MTNPNDAIGTNGAFGGRTSVNAFNDSLAAYSTRGVISGWDCVPKTGLTVSLGGTAGVRDVAAAMDANGNFTTINNISGSAVDVTMPAAPASNKRIDLVVAYVDNPPQGNTTDVDNPDACGIISVSGTAAANPTPPTEANIRSAITADGASGSTAYYVILAKITITSGTTDIDATMIQSGVSDLGAEMQGGKVGTQAIQDGAVTAAKLDWSTFEYHNSETNNYGYPTAYTNTLSYTTLSAGKFLAIASGTQTATTNNTFYQRLIQTRGGTSVANTARYVSGISSAAWSNFSMQYIFNCQAGDVIAIQRQASTATSADGNNRTTLTIVRIA